MKLLMISLILFFSFSTWAQTILFLGDSLTEGYQINKEEAYPSIIEKTLKTTRPDLKVINGGVSGATSASGVKRLDWYLKASPDIMVLALGSNDGLRGTKIEVMEKNLSAIIEKAQKAGIKVILAGQKMPANMGTAYGMNFESVFPRLAKKFNIPLIPFLLDGVGAVPRYNLPDGIHPNPKGHEIMARTVLKVLEPQL
jgi:acyl-CoA thioesterase I